MKNAQTIGVPVRNDLPWYTRARRYIRRYWFLYLLVLPGLAFMSANRHDGALIHVLNPTRFQEV